MHPVLSVYRFSPALLVRAIGAFVVLAGLLVLAASLLLSALDVPAAALGIVAVLVVVTGVVAGFAAVRLVQLVRFDEEGYQVRLLRGAGVKQGRWREVEDAVTASVGGHRCVVLRLRDGRTTTIPVGVLDTTPDAFLADLSARLDRGHGYRRLS